MIRICFFIIFLTPFLFGVENIKDALKSGELEGQIQALSFDIANDDDTKSAYTTILGGFLNYKSNTYKNTYFGIRFYSVNPVSSSKNPQKFGLFDEDSKSIDSMTEGYIGLIDGRHMLKIGRQHLNTPLMNDKVTPYSYSGLHYKWQAQKNNNIIFGKINTIKKINERHFSTLSDAGEMDDGVAYIGTSNKKASGLAYKLYYYNAKELFDSTFFQVGKDINFDRFKLFSTFQYIKTNKNSSGKNIDPKKENGGNDVQINAIRLGIKYSKAGLLAVYSENNGDDGLAKAYGGQAELFTNTIITTGINRGGPKIVSLRFKYNWSTQISSRLIYSDTKFRLSEHPDVPGSYTNDYRSTYLDTKYKYTKGSYLYIRYEHMDRTLKDTDISYFRAALVQSF